MVGGSLDRTPINQAIEAPPNQEPQNFTLGIHQKVRASPLIIFGRPTFM